MLSVLSLNTAYAALTATTAQTIKGTAPYFTLGGVQLNNTAELLGFTYTDASGTSGIKATADASVDGTIIVVDPNMKMSDIKAVVPINSISTALSSVIGGDLNIADVDGDVMGGTSAIGAMRAYWLKDGKSYFPPVTEKFDPCSAYTLTIAITDPATGVVASSAGNVEALTTYGDPNNQQYTYPATAGSTPTNIYSATYTIQPKTAPQTCYAQPNLTHGDERWAGPASQWSQTKGFLPQTAPNKNFPTTGFYGAWFNLTVAGTTAASIINKMDSTAGGSPLTGYVTSGDIKLKLIATKTNVINITLFGPRDGTVTTQNEAGAPTRKFTPTPFTLKDSSGANVYAFTIEKWFITKNVALPYSTGGNGVWSVANLYGFNGNLEAPKYCENLGGTMGNYYYRLPKRLDFTNSPAVNWVAWNGTHGTGWDGTDIPDNHYTRMIAGGIASEWGRMTQTNNEYPLSEWNKGRYWLSEAANSGNQYTKYDSGAIGYNVPGEVDPRYVACVSY